MFAFSNPKIFSRSQEKPRVWGCSDIMFLMSSTMAGTCSEQLGSAPDVLFPADCGVSLLLGYR